MLTCEYRHPLRALRFEFTVDTNVIRLLSYTESDALTMATPLTADVTIVNSNEVMSHAYPIDVDDAERRTFELEQFLQELQSDRDRLVVVISDGLREGTAWSTILGIPEVSSGVYTDIECVLAAASLDEPSVYVGRSGHSWWIAETGTSVKHLVRLPTLDVGNNVQMVTDSIAEFLRTCDVHARKLVLFGDAVTPQLLVAAQQAAGKHVDVVERFQPFRHVRASLDQQSGQRILARAHLLGGAVGAMLLYAGLVPEPAQPLVLA